MPVVTEADENKVTDSTGSVARLNFWDIGGQKSIRPFWRNYFEETDAIVWVIDSFDVGRLEDARIELESVLNEDVRISLNLISFYSK